MKLFESYQKIAEFYLENKLLRIVRRPKLYNILTSPPSKTILYNEETNKLIDEARKEYREEGEKLIKELGLEGTYARLVWGC